MRLVGYVRVSQVKGREGDSFQSPRQQADAIRGIAAARGAHVVELIEDFDQSGGTMARPGLDRALAMIERGDADGLAVAKLDRFARDSAGIGMIADLEKRGKTFMSAADSFDTSTSVGRFALGMMILVAQLERDRHVELWDETASRHIARGVHVRATYGYRRSDGRGSPLEPDPETSGVVQDVFDWRAQGEGPAAIERKLNSAGVPSPAGRAWTRQQVKAMLRNPVYLGQARRGRHVRDDAHEPIVSVELWRQVQRDPGPALRGEGGLLAGLARCAGCGYIMGRSTSRGQARYGCQRVTADGQCPSPTTVFAHNLEPFVEAAFLDRYGDVGLKGAEVLPDAEIADAQAQLDRLADEFERWRDDVEMRAALGEDDYRAGLLVRQKAVRAARETHARLVRTSTAMRLVIPSTAWEGFTVPEKRELFKAAIETVWLRRARSTHDPVDSRVFVHWIGEPDCRPVV